MAWFPWRRGKILGYRILFPYNPVPHLLRCKQYSTSFLSNLYPCIRMPHTHTQAHTHTHTHTHTQGPGTRLRAGLAVTLLPDVVKSADGTSGYYQVMAYSLEEYTVV
jgi:hypothetical protein